MKDWSETIKNYCQIIAILVAGWWTYHLFSKKEAPGLESRANATSSLSWFQTAGTDDWEVDFGVSMENKGTTSLNLAKIRVRAWEFDYGMAGEHIEFFDPDKIQSKAPGFEKTYALNKASVLPFPSHFPPGAIAGNSFVWLLRNPDCKKRVYFLAEFFRKGDDFPNWSTYQWGQECSREENSDGDAKK